MSASHKMDERGLMEAWPALGQDLWDDKGAHEKLGTEWLRRLRQEMLLGADSFSHHCFCFISQELCLSSVGSQAKRISLLGNVPPQRFWEEGKSKS